MDTLCFICGDLCEAIERNCGSFLSRTLETPIKSLLLRCLHAIIDVDREFFCSKCVRKLEEYDQMLRRSKQIEKDLLEIFQKRKLHSYVFGECF